jgi:hypothetical protein
MAHQTTLERFWSKVDKTDDCWLWTASTNKGYGHFGEGRRTLDAHRWSYEQFVGPIPAGKVLDHVCHSRDAANCTTWSECQHRRCVNPAHLEPVTQRVNTLRGNAGAWNAVKTHCPQGHEYTPENTYVNSGRRHCITCKRRHSARSKARKRAAA